MIVMKFGGTSVEDANAMRHAGKVIQHQSARGLVVVVSACAGVTNTLLEISETAGSRDVNNAMIKIAQLYRRHLSIAQDLLPDPADTSRFLQTHFDELSGIVRSVAILGELSSRTLDRILGFGEAWSSHLLTAYLEQIGISSALIPAGSFFITNGQHQTAEPLTDVIRIKAKELIEPVIRSGHVVITQGFVGATYDGVPATLGRGGSDYSASVIGAALDADEIQIWTDTNGVLTADPRVVHEALTLPDISYQEAEALASLGAKVLHPKTIAPAVRKRIPVRVLNSRNPDHPGTTIVGEHPSHPVFTGITYRRHLIKITLPSSAECFQRCLEHQVKTDGFTLSGGHFIFFAENTEGLASFLETDRSGTAVIEDHFASVSLVGWQIREKEDMLVRTTGLFREIAVQPVQFYYDPSGNQWTCIIRKGDVDTVVRSMHDNFFGTSWAKRAAAAS